MSTPVPVTIHKFEVRFNTLLDEFEADVYWEWSLDSAPTELSSDFEPGLTVTQIKTVLADWATAHNYALTQLQL